MKLRYSVYKIKYNILCTLERLYIVEWYQNRYFDKYSNFDKAITFIREKG